MTVLSLSIETRYQERFCHARDFIALSRYVLPILCLFAALPVAVYLIALFVSFGAGFKIRGAEQQGILLSREVADLQLTLQQKELRLQTDYADILGGMESVEDVTYISGGSSELSYRSPALEP